MAKVNITPATKKIAERVNMYVDSDTKTVTVDDHEVEIDSVVIGDEDRSSNTQKCQQLTYIVATQLNNYDNIMSI